MPSVQRASEDTLAAVLVAGATATGFLTTLAKGA